MLQVMKLCALLWLLALIAYGSTPKVGGCAPQFSLPASDGRTVALKDYAGKKLVLVFYRGYWWPYFRHKGIVRWSFFEEDYKVGPLGDVILDELKKIK